MAEKFKLDVVTPSRLLVSDEVEEVTAPGVEGEFGVLPGHTPFLTALGVGELMYRKGTAVQYIAMCHGFAEVTHDKATILAEEAEFPHEIDVQEAEAAKAEAEKEIAGLSHDSKEYLEAQAKLERAMNHIQVASRRR
ncbi:MAG: F0F1 ATP synthase subunit epsilon [Deltaproteobacteria bacterium]|nr:F0F1 ATP synthase subunit epsilon [Deltaproteobacteria bacterium]